MKRPFAAARTITPRTASKVFTGKAVIAELRGTGTGIGDMVTWKTSDPASGTEVSYRNDGTANTGYVSGQVEPLGQSVALTDPEPPNEPSQYPSSYEQYLFSARESEWECKVSDKFYGGFQGMPDHCQKKRLMDLRIPLAQTFNWDPFKTQPCEESNDPETISVCTETTRDPADKRFEASYDTSSDCLNAIYSAVPKDMLIAAQTAVPLLTDAAEDIGYSLAELAYLLASVEHESHFGNLMTEIWGPTGDQNGYEPRFSSSGRVTNQKAKELGNTQVGDGKRFLGRGYLQITGRGNYSRFGAMLVMGAFFAGDWSGMAVADIKVFPENAAIPTNAAKIAALGLKVDLFKQRGRNLDDVIKQGTFQEFLKARNFVGGRYINVGSGRNRHRIDVGSNIANRALEYLGAMQGICN
ncbi:MAG: hypothetical protein K1X52_07705 [Pyrinomonadaceae bacterium]|nr:hypothetical protein [Pyrinomonadaceae bacterium]